MRQILICVSLALIAFAPGDAASEKRANDLYVAKDYKSALPLYQALATEQPKAPRMHYRYGLCLLKTEDFRTAEKEFLKAKELGAPEAFVSYNLACVYLRLGDKPKGLGQLEASAAAGFRNFEQLKSDSDFDSVRFEPRYTKALAKMENPLLGVKNADAMDIWVGDWVVTIDGQLVGENSIKKVLRGYGITEAWRPGAAAVEGMSLFAFDIGEKVWRHTWTNSDGWTIFRTGKPVKDGIYFEGISAQPGQANQKTREWITKNPDGTVRQLIEMQNNKTKKWASIFDAIYTRKKAG